MSVFWKDKFPFSVGQQEGRKISLFSEIRVSRKDQMFLKYRNRQWRLAIWPSILMFNRKFPSSTGFLFLFRPTKRWKISHHIISLAVVILSRFQCVTRCLIIYPFPASQLNSSWWSYPCILPLIFNIAWSFNFFVGRKENHFTLLYHVLC